MCPTRTCPQCTASCTPWSRSAAHTCRQGPSGRHPCMRFSELLPWSRPRHITTIRRLLDCAKERALPPGAPCDAILQRRALAMTPLTALYPMLVPRHGTMAHSTTEQGSDRPLPMVTLWRGHPAAPSGGVLCLSVSRGRAVGCRAASRTSPSRHATSRAATPATNTAPLEHRLGHGSELGLSRRVNHGPELLGQRRLPRLDAARALCPR